MLLQPKRCIAQPGPGSAKVLSWMVPKVLPWFCRLRDVQALRAEYFFLLCQCSGSVSNAIYILR